MLPIHVFYAIDVVRERHREEARRNALRREREAVHPVAPRRSAPRRVVARAAMAISAGAASLARSVYEQAVDGPGAPESSLG